eukprot:CAMPEP_0198369260 /NCGR_PEP_ID=MMETSP1450-20131203/156119_1 /TAXON_ID=753684 ORGANISM="Madagascaria erythrocladiodes, Strain CCMP3234" /NCGR_SAMPLE_ID=MMETSP1450 /ASSEMBLY_ACC=CAM_ASM_001115 /LENGTH=197 /DNA_ID=CAMNT_0044076779 /DNA_START=201 /DNA_END=795 /DNA_ORIENTATION=-
MTSQFPTRPPEDKSSPPWDFRFLYDFTHVPCFREAMLYSIGGGSAMGGLRFYRTRNGMKAADTAVKSFVLFAAISWFVCRREYRQKRESVYQGVHQQNERIMEVVRETAKARQGAEDTDRDDNNATAEGKKPKLVIQSVATRQAFALSRRLAAVNHSKANIRMCTDAPGLTDPITGHEASLASRLRLRLFGSIAGYR